MSYPFSFSVLLVSFTCLSIIFYHVSKNACNIMALMKTALSVKALSQHNAFVKSMSTYHYQVHLSNINHPMKHVGRLFKFKHITSIKYSLG